MGKNTKVRLYLMGSPRLETVSGERLKITSKKAIALLAALATAGRFERSRVWLQQTLWGSRAPKQAQSSLRRELSNLRSALRNYGLDLIRSDHRTVSLVEDHIEVDVLSSPPAHTHHEFLEGLDLADEEGFEDWLRQVRSSLTNSPNPSLERSDDSPKVEEVFQVAG